MSSEGSQRLAIDSSYSQDNFHLNQTTEKIRIKNFEDLKMVQKIIKSYFTSQEVKQKHKKKAVMHSFVLNTVKILNTVGRYMWIMIVCPFTLTTFTCIVTFVRHLLYYFPSHIEFMLKTLK